VALAANIAARAAMTCSVLIATTTSAAVRRKTLRIGDFPRVVTLGCFVLTADRPIGANTMHGDAGIDLLIGDRSNDRHLGEDDGDHTLDFEATDTVEGGSGDDHVNVRNANNFPGADPVSCSPGTDTAFFDARDSIGKDCERRDPPRT
jgi:hypothetical protein